MPGLLLITGVAGILIRDPGARAALVDTIAGVLPPVRELASSVLAETAKDAAPVSLLGVVALIWGTSRFVVAFEDGLARVTGGAKRRSLLVSNLGAIGAVALLVVAILASTVLAGVTAFLEAGESVGVVAVLDRGLGLALGILPIFIAMAAVGVVYRFVPLPAPRWRSIGLPAIVVGLVLIVLARAFIFLAPRLIGAAALLGTLASVFAALAWLSLSFQALLLGAAWVSERELASEEPVLPDADVLPSGELGPD